MFSFVTLDRSAFTVCPDVDSAAVPFVRSCGRQAADRHVVFVGRVKEENQYWNEYINESLNKCRKQNKPSCTARSPLRMKVTHAAHIFQTRAVLKRLHELAHNWTTDNKREIRSSEALIDPDTVTMFTKANILSGMRRLPPAGHANHCVQRLQFQHTSSSLLSQLLASDESPSHISWHSPCILFSPSPTVTSTTLLLCHPLPLYLLPPISFKMEDLPLHHDWCDLIE